MVSGTMVSFKENNSRIEGCKIVLIIITQSYKGIVIKVICFHITLPIIFIDSSERFRCL